MVSRRSINWSSLERCGARSEASGWMWKIKSSVATASAKQAPSTAPSVDEIANAATKFKKATGINPQSLGPRGGVRAPSPAPKLQPDGPLRQQAAAEHVNASARLQK